MNEEQQELPHDRKKVDWLGALLLLLGLLAIMGAIKYGAPWLWNLLK